MIPGFSQVAYLSAFFFASIPTAAQAQEITADGTTATTVTSPDGNNFTIEGGNRPEGGSNLFHSFQDFSVPTNGSAAFNNAVDIQNIFSRVTGGKISSIDGLIKANGSANLFLINPAGIMFGNNARLDIGGSFLSSTADSILFPDGEFSAVDLDSPPLLTINAPIGLGFRDNPGDLQVQGSSLEVKPSQTLALIGGDLSFNGGRLELGSVASASVVNLEQTPQGLVVEYEDVPNFGDIQLNQQAILNANGVSGGSINIQGARLSMQGGSQIVSTTQGNGQGGDINITTTESIEIIGNGFEQFQESFIRGILSGTTQSLEQETGISVGISGTGEGGDIIIDTSSLLISNGALIFSPTSTSGIGGDIIINASESIELIGSALSSISSLNSTAPAGDIVVQAKNLEIRDGGLVLNSTLGSGSGGDIVVKVSETVELANTPVQALVPTGILASSTLGTGQAGNIEMNASNLFVSNGAGINNNSGSLISDSTSRDGILRHSGGNAGDININVSKLINLTGVSRNGTTSGITSAAFRGSSSAGDINIATENLVIQDGARIDAATVGSGQGGEITLKARESVIVSGKSQLEEAVLVKEAPSTIAATSGFIGLSFEAEATGKAGNLNIETRKLVIQDGAKITVNSLSGGEAGIVRVIAESINLDNESAIDAATVSGQGGEITLLVDRTINLTNNSLISAEAANKANGGNVTIDAEFIIASLNQNNDIIASAEQGNGGKINITAEGIFGLKERSSTPPNNTNDIDASSEFGLDGTVALNTPDTTTLQESVEVPEIVELETLGVNACSGIDTIEEVSRFEVTGKGGVAPIPTAPLTADALVIEGKSSPIGMKQPERVQQEQIKPIVTAQGLIYPARGIIFKENGDIILTAYPTDNVQRIPHNSPNCSKS